ncbi:SDR family oxidoreductase [Labrenzia sp. VG12]|uniref:SDR family oxidoreductase n=1 Tax=Labrenzia sp. VG12 TaxID=2021862 RepID=UPI000B8C2893|nr:SDR family oxidoreductase [Labrenzia sp. VG12]ASP33689.1 saccharopine dehydrogenase [Labrenzia sp. VG12]
MTDAPSRKRIVILGGYGVFGGKLAMALLRSGDLEVVVAGRNLDRAQAFCSSHGGRPAVLDRAAPDFEQSLNALSPFVTVDAAGPFQAYEQAPYRVAEAALAAQSHYLDLSDDAAFTAGIGALEKRAGAAGLTALSGVSSVPALSSAAVEALREDFSRLDLIESAILPGNRAPRGLSVMRAILGQTGRPLAVFRDGAKVSVPGWSGLEKRRIGPSNKTSLPPRWTSFIGAPDLTLFPDKYGARTVLFRAGLELSVMHLGLWALSFLVRLRLMRSLEALARPLQTIADWLEPLGTDRGGMEVRLAGLDLEGKPLDRRWTLIAEAGDGPHIPAVAAAILCQRLVKGTVPPGARAYLGEISLEEVSEATRHLNVTTHVGTRRQPCLFQQALGLAFEALPEPVKDLHTVFDKRCWSGEARVTRGSSFLSRLVCRIVGFPAQTDSTPVSVTIERRGDCEIWERDFGGKVFTSVLGLKGKQGTGIVQERFGPMTFDIHLNDQHGTLAFPVARGRVLGLPLPRWLLPVSEATETDRGGVFHFDVSISLPLAGLLVRYQGKLEETACRKTTIVRSAG